MMGYSIHTTMGGETKFLDRASLVSACRYDCLVGSMRVTLLWDGNRFLHEVYNKYYHHYDEGRRIGKVRPLNIVCG